MISPVPGIAEAAPGDPSTLAEAARRPGRKRDLAAEQRILRAALEVFTSGGWRGFSLDSVARVAGAGKSTMYLRYANRQELLLAVLAEYGYTGAASRPDHGSLRADLADFAHSYAQWLDGPAGFLSIRIAVEARLNPDFAEVVRPVAVSQMSQAHAIIRRAKRRGEIPGSVSTAVLLDAVVGGLINHTVSAPGKAPYASAAGRRFVDELVTDILDGVVLRGG